MITTKSILEKFELIEEKYISSTWNALKSKNESEILSLFSRVDYMSDVNISKTSKSTVSMSGLIRKDKSYDIKAISTNVDSWIRTNNENIKFVGANDDKSIILMKIKREQYFIFPFDSESVYAVNS